MLGCPAEGSKAKAGVWDMAGPCRGGGPAATGLKERERAVDGEGEDLQSEDC